MDTTTDSVSTPPTSISPSSALPSPLTTANKILTAKDPLQLIEDSGVDLVKLLKNLNKIALSAKIMAKDRDGDVFELGEDNRAQTTATIAIFELAKLIKDKSVVTQVGVFNDPAIVAEANRVLALRGKI